MPKPMSEWTEEDHRIHLAKQCKSTQKALGFQAKGSSLAEETPIDPSKWKANPNAKSIEEMVGWREFTFEEARIERQLRYSRGGLLAIEYAKEKYPEKMRDTAPPSSVDEAKREKAIAAYMQIEEHFADIMKKWGLANEIEYEFAKLETGKK